ncbi:MAG TPA: glycosyltransferase family 4 protein, partial [Gemmatimonadaceae bacterium]|nr:glycosyltransferase family 4 protein [Gemmatimonadaceae bacterium]
MTSAPAPPPLRLLLVNWQDRENPQAGGAETHLHEIFGRLAARGHEVTLLCSGWTGCAPRTTLDGIQVHRVGTRYTFQFMARRYYTKHLAKAGHDVLVEDINKIPLY